MDDDDDDLPERGAAPGQSARSTSALLLEFLAGHNQPCPVCGYGLRGLREPRCPECKHELTLTVGAARLRILHLLLFVTPSAFSLVAAVVLLGLIVIVLIVEPGGGFPPGMVVLDAFGFLSGSVGVAVAMRPYRFLALPKARQSMLITLSWAVHLTAFAVLLALALLA